MVNAQRDVITRLMSCYGTRLPFSKDQLIVALNLRACPDQTEVCNKIVATRTPGLSSNQFEKLYGWLTLAGTRSPNQWLSLDANGSWVVIREIAERYQWAPPPDSAVAMEQLEKYVNRFHEDVSSLEKLSYVVPSLAGLSKRTAAHILDVVNNPFSVASTLPEKGGPIFGRISDETARSRIVDCSRLRGDLTVEAIQACAGVKIDPSGLASCLNKGSCLPDYVGDAFVTSMAINGKETLKEMASNTILPRVGTAVANAVDWEKRAASCFDAYPNKSEDAANCLLKSTMNTEDYEAVACVRKPDGAIVDRAAILECVSRLSNAPGAKIVTDCLGQAKSGSAATIECAAMAAVPPEVRTLYSCASGLAGNDVDNLVAKCAAGSLSPPDRELAACMVRASSSAARVACLGVRAFPGEEGIIGCAAQLGDDWKAAAGCVVAEKIPGDAGKVISCGVRNGGINLGTAICVAGLDSHLTAEQQIVLQCASTDPEPIGFAACTAGGLTIKEFMQCREAHAGSSHCFGENNEIRKLIRALGLPDLTENSEGAKILDMHIEVYRFQYAMAEKGVKTASDFIAGTGKALNQLGRSLEDAYRHLGDAANDLIKGAGDAILSCFGLC
jgi:hypothetical protein